MVEADEKPPGDRQYWVLIDNGDLIRFKSLILSTNSEGKTPK
jgi:hypothetical protein